MRSPLYSPILAALSPDDRVRLLGRSSVRTFAPGEILVLAGSPASTVYLVDSGAVKLVMLDDSAREIVVGLAVAGDLVGEIAAIEDQCHDLDAVAASNCVVLGLPADELMAAVRATPAAAAELARILAAKVQLMTKQSVKATGSGHARLAHRLLELAELLGQMRGTEIEMELPLRQDELGALAGLCRESTCKTLKGFRRAGVLDYKGRRIRIVRPDLLEKISCGARASSPCR